ncbi:unnamed protein product [Sphagnum jensenii]|uniref:Uncharacterized protein n=1 Tax=Sphagnum jensenii TaxID=128206 RepID=A0ABP1BTK2_9BRYO
MRIQIKNVSSLRIDDVERLMEIIRQAAQEETLVFFTLADPQMAEATNQACEMLHVPHINILGPITDALHSHLGVFPSGLPRGAPGRPSTINPVLCLARSRTLGMGPNSRTTYSDIEHISKELKYSRKLFLQNARWHVVEVTGKAIEETTVVILRIFHERRSKNHMPRISWRY